MVPYNTIQNKPNQTLSRWFDLWLEVRRNAPLNICFLHFSVCSAISVSVHPRELWHVRDSRETKIPFCMHTSSKPTKCRKHHQPQLPGAPMCKLHHSFWNLGENHSDNFVNNSWYSWWFIIGHYQRVGFGLATVSLSPVLNISTVWCCIVCT